jgi:hypothetical protein
MSVEDKASCDWTDWREFLLNAFELRLSAMREKGYQAAPARNTVTALFLQARGFETPASGTIPEAFKLLREAGSDDPRFDSLAMFGHHLGMVEDAAGFKQYLHDIRERLKPEGHVLLTSVDTRKGVIPGQAPCQGQSRQMERLPGLRQVQSEKLIGPFYCLLQIKAEALKNRAVTTNWKCEFIHLQDDNNYLARLSLP